MSARLSGLKASPVSAHDWAAARAAASDAFTMARRFRSRPPTSIVSTSMPMMAIRASTVITTTAPDSSFAWVRASADLGSDRLAPERPFDLRVQAERGQQGDVDREDLLDTGRQARGSIDTVTDWSTAVASPGSGHPPTGVIVRPVYPAGSAPAEAPTTASRIWVSSPPTAATRAPSRADARRLWSCQKAKPYSIMPKINMASRPTINANSTAAAPSSRWA